MEIKARDQLKVTKAKEVKRVKSERQFSVIHSYAEVLEIKVI